jgi:hypothetical protein
MNKIVMLLLAGLFACSGCSTGTVEPNFTIKVSGTNGLEFSGHYVTVTGGRISTWKLVEGKAPDQYAVSGSTVSCTIRKKAEKGILSVQIIKDGKIVSSSETAIAYGSVNLRVVSEELSENQGAPEQMLTSS